MLISKNILAMFCCISLSSPLADCAGHDSYSHIIIRKGSHPAIKAAAEILSKTIGVPGSEIHEREQIAAPQQSELILVDRIENSEWGLWGIPKPKYPGADGYIIVFRNGGALVLGIRPRSLLYAAEDFELWGKKQTGVYRREPSFAVRSCNYEDLYSDRMGVAELVAYLGVNRVCYKKMEGNGSIACSSIPEIYAALSEDDRKQIMQARESDFQKSQRFARKCQQADIPYYAFLYGNDLTRWSKALAAAVYKTHPEVKGKQMPYALETASMCPSEPMTWKIIEAYVNEFIEVNAKDAEGVITTFWDWYGINCHCEKCRANGLDQFSNQLFKYVDALYTVLNKKNKKLIVRTWASGCSYWTPQKKSGNWVTGPGYGYYAGSNEDLWRRVINELPADISLLTKIYYSDCQPDARFNPLIGQAKPHDEIIEYQMSGQTQGRFYFPASIVEHTAWSMKKSYQLLRDRGGIQNFFGPYVGRYAAPDYVQMDDSINSINLYVWRELSWDIHADTETLWERWAVPIYGAKAAKYIIPALEMSESVINTVYTVKGLGGNNEGEFCHSIAEREMFLKFTNRYYLPEFARYLEPAKDNIEIVRKEKLECLAKIDQMFSLLEKARPYLNSSQYKELYTRFDWLREFAFINARIEVSYWRYRYLQYLRTIYKTDIDQLTQIVEAYKEVENRKNRLFRYDPESKFSCFNKINKNLNIKPFLGDPMPLMHEIYEQSVELAEDVVGPAYLPQSLKNL